MASSTVSENTEMQSSVRQAGTRPAVEISPRLGFKPTILLSIPGTRPLPAVSVPSASGTRPAATATADPDLDPPGIRSPRTGLTGLPYAERTPTTPAPTGSSLALPMITQPAP